MKTGYQHASFNEEQMPSEQLERLIMDLCFKTYITNKFIAHWICTGSQKALLIMHQHKIRKKVRFQLGHAHWWLGIRLNSSAANMRWRFSHNQTVTLSLIVNARPVAFMTEIYDTIRKCHAQAPTT